MGDRVKEKKVLIFKSFIAKYSFTYSLTDPSAQLLWLTLPWPGTNGL